MDLCCLCGKSSIFPKLMKMYGSKKLPIHAACMIFNPFLYKRRNKKNTIEGFPIPDIKKELKRCENKICAYCHKKKSPIKCSHEGCNNYFHFDCGLVNGALYLSFGKYKPLCSKHVPQCFCLEPVNGVQKSPAIQPKCCKGNFYHENCIIDYVMDAGSTSKCPYCGNIDVFRKQLLSYNIKIPNRKAKYARNIDYSYSVACSAVECLCQKGRSYHEEGSNWELILCVNCGSEAIHKNCFTTDIWICFSCTPDVDNDKKDTKSYPSHMKQCGGKHETEKFKPLKNENSSDELKKEQKTLLKFGPFRIVLPLRETNL